MKFDESLLYYLNIVRRRDMHRYTHTHERARARILSGYWLRTFNHSFLLSHVFLTLGHILTHARTASSLALYNLPCLSILTLKRPPDLRCSWTYAIRSQGRTSLGKKMICPHLLVWVGALWRSKEIYRMS